ncbi:unnamed protein product [Anisakis simplex]|uniref:MFS domain-containing protein n=1 Tax=Anisakis simplex TaxID=6269 RepID=A0A0M3K079_ANISI|nr:unnamed protein product [Anisakis simplex]
MLSFMVPRMLKGHLLWTPAMQSTLFSATYYGGLVTVLPGGILADRFSPKIILMIAIADYVLISALTPLLVNVNYYAFFAARILMGFGEGLVLPTMSSLAARWFPQTERSTIAAIYTSGNQVATSSISVIGSALCTADFLGGWPSIFYCLAIVGVVWIVLWYLLVSSSPDESRWASKREKRYLSTYVENTDKQLMVINSIPWLSIALSAPMIADLLSTFAANYTATMFQAFLPTFYKEVLFVDLHKNGWFTTAPFITQLISKNIMGIISDKLKRSSVLSPTVACKIFQVSGIGAAAVIPGSMTSLISLAPNYTGTLISISMIFGQIANMAAPNVVALVKRKVCT